MSYDSILPFPLGSFSTNASIASFLGKRFSVDGVGYMMVVSSGSITAANLFLQWGDAAAFSVDAVGGAAEVKGAIAGLGITGQDAIVSGDYSFVIRRGLGDATTSTTGLVKEVAIATHGTAGKIDDLTVTYATAIAHTIEAQASADSLVGVFVDLP